LSSFAPRIDDFDILSYDFVTEIFSKKLSLNNSSNLYSKSFITKSKSLSKDLLVLFLPPNNPSPISAPGPERIVLKFFNSDGNSDNKDNTSFTVPGYALKYFPGV